jgi:hypothetical protein
LCHDGRIDPIAPPDFSRSPEAPVIAVSHLISREGARLRPSWQLADPAERERLQFPGFKFSMYGNVHCGFLIDFSSVAGSPKEKATIRLGLFRVFPRFAPGRSHEMRITR